MIYYIGVGSNVGDRLGYIRKAIHCLNKKKKIEIRRCSPLYETEAWGSAKKQRDYFNLVIEADTALTPRHLLEELKRIEKEAGRKFRKERWSPREIDLDILFCHDTVIKEEDLKVPHPLAQKRFFVLKPLADLAPYFKHPESGLSIEETLGLLKKEGRWRRCDEEIIPKHEGKKDRRRVRRAR